MIGVRARRHARVAEAEGLSSAELDDAVQLLAARYPITADEVLAVVEDHGLANAPAQIEMSLRA